MKGRKPTPNSLKLLTGNPSKRPITSIGMEPDPDIPKTPKHLKGEALAEWKRITPQLEAIGLISQVDRAAVAAYCSSWARWVAAEEALAKEGLIIETTNGNIIQHPAVGISNTAMQLMHKYLIEFGMTPSSRARVPKDETKKKENKFSGLINVAK